MLLRFVLFFLIAAPCWCEDHILKIDQMTPPEYPPLARAARLQGDVALEIQIDRDGKVIDARAASGHPLLQKYAQENIRTWKFKIYGPAVTYPFHHLMTYTFRLEGDPKYPVH